MNQVMQDQNAKKVSNANYTNRAVSKSKAVYKNESWDLVDKAKQDPNAISKMKKRNCLTNLKINRKLKLKQL